VHVTPPAAAPFDGVLAAVFAVGIGVPIALGLAIAGPLFALTAGVGALNALWADPRRRAITRFAAIGAAIALLLAASGVAAQLRPWPHAAEALAVVLAFFAGFVPATFRYVSVVAKLVPLVVVALSSLALPHGNLLAGFLAGSVFATVLAVAVAAWRGVAPYADPVQEIRRMWEGERNDVAYALAYAGAVALALVLAHVAGEPRPFWAALAALFVMHPDRTQATKQIGQRIAGTFVGVAVAWVVVAAAPDPWVVVAASIVAAALMPWANARGVLAGTGVATAFVLMLLDIGFYAQGGDLPLMAVRLWDTLIGTAAVAVATLALDRWRRRAPARPE
jgi:uncharacterized membrane protein YccC